MVYGLTNRKSQIDFLADLVDKNKHFPDRDGVQIGVVIKACTDCEPLDYINKIRTANEPPCFYPPTLFTLSKP